MNEILLKDIKPGMIGLSGGESWIQRKIKFFTKSNYSHSFTIMKGPSGLDALETTDTVVCLSPMERKVYEKNYVDIWEPIASDEIKELAAKECYTEFSSEWYGYLSYLWFMYYWLMGLFGKKPTKIWKWCPKGITCTELSCHYVIKLGNTFSNLFNGVDLNTQSPERLYEKMKQNTTLFKYLGRLENHQEK